MVLALPIVAAAAGAVVVAAGPAPASAPPDPAALLRRGTELYKAGVWDKAAQAFQAAWALAPSSTTALNLAQALEGAGRPADARSWYAKVIAGEPAGPRREAAVAGEAHLRGHGFLAVTCGPPGATLKIDAVPRGTCPTWGGYLPAGRHPVELEAPERVPYAGDTEVVGGERRELTLDLAREVRVVLVPTPSSGAGPESGPSDVGAAAKPGEPDEPAIPPWIGYTAMGVGAVALLVGGYYYSQAADAADSASGGAGGSARARDRQLEEDFEGDAVLAYTGLGVGGVFLLGGGALLLFGGAF